MLQIGTQAGFLFGIARGAIQHAAFAVVAVDGFALQHGVDVVGDALQQVDAKICTLPTQASRVRITGAFAEESFSPKRGMGKRENRYFHFFARLRTWMDKRRN